MPTWREVNLTERETYLVDTQEEYGSDKALQGWKDGGSWKNELASRKFVEVVKLNKWSHRENSWHVHPTKERKESNCELRGNKLM